MTTNPTPQPAPRPGAAEASTTSTTSTKSRDTRPATCIDCGGARDPEREAAGKWRCSSCASAAAERRKQPPKPTLVTWCPEPDCGKSGMRRPDEPLDETCRYCDAGEVRMRRFPTRTQARAFLTAKQAERSRAGSRGETRGEPAQRT